MRFGVNYTPRVGWFHSWLDLNLDDVRRDFAAIAELGLDHVRIFGLWPLLQPNRTLIRQRGLDDIAAVVRCAHAEGLDVVVDALQGHLSSFDFVPSWVSSWHRRNLFTDPEVRSGQRDLVTALARRLADEPGALGLSVGNEFIQFAAPRHPDQHLLTPPEADGWLGDLLGAATAAWPTGLHTHSYDDDLFFDPGHPFTPAHAVGHGGLTTVHSWVFAHLGPQVGVDHPWLAWFARYLLELAVAWSDDPDRGVWLQEVGAPASHVSPGQAARFTEQTLRHAVGCERLWGITWWCSHDVTRELVDFPELEYSLGLFDADGQRKPSADAMAEFIAHTRAEGSSAIVANRPEIVFDDHDLASARAATHPTGAVFAAWVSAAVEGTVPVLVRRSRASTRPRKVAAS